MFTASPWDGSVPCHPYDAVRMVYIDVPKCASSSIKRSLAHLIGDERGKDWPDIHRYTGYTYADGDILREWLTGRWVGYWKFTIVRHPFDRFRAFWSGSIGKLLLPRAERRAELIDPNAWVLARIDDPWWSDVHAIPQRRLIGDPSLYDHIGRMEDIESFRSRLSEQVGAEVVLPHTNRSQGSRLALDERTKGILREVYREDFEAFEFDPEAP